MNVTVTAASGSGHEPRVIRDLRLANSLWGKYYVVCERARVRVGATKELALSAIQLAPTFYESVNGVPSPSEPVYSHIDRLLKQHRAIRQMFDLVQHVSTALKDIHTRRLGHVQRLAVNVEDQCANGDVNAAERVKHIQKAVKILYVFQQRFAILRADMASRLNVLEKDLNTLCAQNLPPIPVEEQSSWIASAASAFIGAVTLSNRSSMEEYAVRRKIDQELTFTPLQTVIDRALEESEAASPQEIEELPITVLEKFDVPQFFKRKLTAEAVLMDDSEQQLKTIIQELERIAVKVEDDTDSKEKGRGPVQWPSATAVSAASCAVQPAAEPALAPASTPMVLTLPPPPSRVATDPLAAASSTAADSSAPERPKRPPVSATNSTLQSAPPTPAAASAAVLVGAAPATASKKSKAASAAATAASTGAKPAA